MKMIRHPRFAPLWLLMLPFLWAAPAAGQFVYDPPIPDEILVRLQPGTDFNAFLEDMRTLADSPDVNLGGDVANRDIYLLLWPWNLNETYVNNYIASRPEVVWAELNYTSETAEGRVRDFFNANASPDDYENQPAWAHVGLPNGQQFANGNGQTIAVLDTGVDGAHPAFDGRVLPGWNFLDDSADTGDAGDGLDNDGDGDVDEMAGHGTFIAGVIAHVAPEANILPVTVLNSDGKSDIFAVAQGWFYAIDNGATVINISLGSTYKCELWEDALDEAVNAGIIVVGAAGNQDINQEFYFEYPAMLRDAIGVGAVDDEDIKADFSNYSLCDYDDPDCDERDQIALVAPGVEICSLLPGDDYGKISGTSVSAAFVSGTVALMLEQHPDWPRNNVLLDYVKAQLQDTAVNVDAQNPGYAGLLGAGRLDVAAAIDDTYPGDFDGDGDVDQSDLGHLLGCYGISACGDLDGDYDTDQADLGLLLAYFGQSG